MRIALSSYRSKPHSGGQGIYVRHLSRELAALGHDVTVFSGPPYPELDDARLVAGRATDRATGPASRQTSSAKRAGATASIEPASIEPTNPGRLRLEKLASLDLYNDDDPFRHPHPRELRDRIDVVEYAGMLSGSFPEPRTFGMRLAREMRTRSREFDVLHDNQTLAPGLLDIARGGLPVVTTIHHPISADRRLEIEAATNPWRKYTKWRWYSFVPMQARVARASSRIITVSETSRDDIVREFGVDRERISVIPVGVDVETFTPDAGVAKSAPGIAVETSAPGVDVETFWPDVSARHRVPGRLTTITSANVPLKGLSVLIDALAFLPQDAWRELVVVGTPNRAVETQLEALGLSPRVRFVSGISDDDLAGLLASAAVHVVPSLYEGFSLPAVEAMACGTPVVATRVGALPQLVHGTDGETSAVTGSAGRVPAAHGGSAGPRAHATGEADTSADADGSDAGILVEPGDARALAGGIVSLLESEETRTRFGRVGRRRAVTTYSWRAVAEATAAVYTEEIARC